MGCINSTKKLTELKDDNIFRVVRLTSGSPELMRTGFLELTPKELTFRTGSNQRLVWALQHLRRYGLNGDVFSFEAGRRCMTGPGIYTFQCQQADELYHLFQTYINAVSLLADETFAFAERDHPSHTLGRLDTNHHTNNYLEPAPLGAVGSGVAILQRSSAFRDSFSSSPLSLDSPDSVPSLSFTTNEVVHFQNQQLSSNRGVYVNTPSSIFSNANSNVYSEHPLRTHIEHNNNLSSAPSSVFNTLTRKNIVKHSSLDIPPEECAPMLSTPSDTLHMYANIENGSFLNRSVILPDIVARNNRRDRESCYENLNRSDLNLILQPLCGPPLSSSRDANTTETVHGQNEPNQTDETSAVNYIVLDLDQPRSPQNSPKPSFGSGLSLLEEGKDTEPKRNADLILKSEPPNIVVPSTAPVSNPTTSTASTTKPIKQRSDTKVLDQKQIEESALGYSTIDFIKTCALIKSSTHSSDFDPEPDNEECRITRHSKGVRKAYSISE